MSRSPDFPGGRVELGQCWPGAGVYVTDHGCRFRFVGACVYPSDCPFVATSNLKSGNGVSLNFEVTESGLGRRSC